MSGINRREFAGAGLAALGGSTMLRPGLGQGRPETKLPTVRWGEHEISRVLVGHNPLKGRSHFSAELSREMRDWFAADPERGRQLLRRCQQLGINTCQMGDTSDWLMREGKIDQAPETLKMFRDAGVLVGLGSHNHEVIDYVEEKGWDVDFYQCSFYRSWFGLNRAGTARGEAFEEEARRSMVKTIRQVSKPCIAFKVLGANRHCRSPAAVERAIRFALKNIKPTDVVLLGMWHKYKDQVAENVGYVRKALGAA